MPALAIVCFLADAFNVRDRVSYVRLLDVFTLTKLTHGNKNISGG